jgi:DNA-binding transcriptional ArsR family regulator
MANQHSPLAPASQKAQILAYVKAHPACTTHDLREAVSLDLARIGMYLARLQNDGLVTREKTRGVRLIRWTAVEPEPADAAPQQTVVQRWEPAQMPAQSWAAALGL